MYSVVFILFFVYFSLSFNIYEDLPFEDPYVLHRWTEKSEKIAQWDQFPTQENVKQLFSMRNGKLFIMLAESSLWFLDVLNGEWKRIDQKIGVSISPLMTILSNDLGEVLLVGGDLFLEMVCNEECIVNQRKSIEIGEVIALNKMGLSTWISSKQGLFLHSNGTVSKVSPHRIQTQINAISSIPTSKEDHLVCFGTDRGVFLFYCTEGSPTLTEFDHFWVEGKIDSNVTALAFDSRKNLLIGNRDGVIEFDPHTYRFQRIGGIEGLPYGNITCIVNAGRERTLFGTKRGLIVRDLRHEAEREWQYFYLDRWIRGEKILSVDALEKDAAHSSAIIVLSDKSASLIDWKVWTLNDKTQFFQEQVYPKHERFGLTSDVHLEAFGDTRKYVKVDSDNDGKHTGTYLASQVYRYGTTKSKEAKENAWKAFEGMELLNIVAGKEKGFVSRSVLERDKSPVGGGEWLNSTEFPDLQFKANTSSDETTQHYWSLNLFHDLVAETQEEKDRVRLVMKRSLDNIIDANYRLLDPSGKPTRWSIWNPENLNDNYDWSGERGLNSLQIIAYLLGLFSLYGDQKYIDSFEYLIEKHGYDRNIINQKIDVPINVCHFDDSLAISAYSLLYHSLQKLNDSMFDHIREIMKQSMQRTYELTRNARRLADDITYALIVNDKEFNFHSSITALKEYPQSRVNWKTQNSHRIDIKLNPEPIYAQLLSKSENVNVLPNNEKYMFRWGDDPFVLDNAGNGMIEFDPSPFLYAYWKARYYGVIGSPVK